MFDFRGGRITYVQDTYVSVRILHVLNMYGTFLKSENRRLATWQTANDDTW
jgi:hypothetical protein